MNYPPAKHEPNIECTRRLKQKTFRHACVKTYIDIYIRLCVRAHRYTCHQTKYALRRRYVTMCILVYNIYAQKDMYTCTIKVYADAHASFTRAWSYACSNSSLHTHTHIYIYIYICIAIVVHERIHKLMHKCIRENQFTR